MASSQSTYSIGAELLAAVTVQQPCSHDEQLSLVYCRCPFFGGACQEVWVLLNIKFHFVFCVRDGPANAVQKGWICQFLFS